MGLFSFFGDGEHRVFDYKPIYYDKEEEERKQKFRAVDGSAEKEKAEGTYAPGTYIKGAFKGGAYQRSRNHTSRVQRIIGIVTMILIFAVLYFIAKFYTLI